MPAICLRPHQQEALKKMRDGCILWGGVGSGKSITSLAYYYISNGGQLDTKGTCPMENPLDLYIITTARKRDSLEWDGELCPFLLSRDPKVNYYNNKVVIDSWNNIGKYKDITNAFFIFDEQRLVGSGAWVKAFYKIAAKNRWILLTATPGDNWEDYIPVFVANGFYRNKTEFVREHVVYSSFTKFPKVDRYLSTGRLIRLRNRILVEMPFSRPTEAHHNDVWVEYDNLKYKYICKTRQIDGEPIKNASQFCYALREVINSDESRQAAVLQIFEEKSKVIIFYNFDYELEILKNIGYGDNVIVAEWNGHKHQPVPENDKWVYLVQYNAGAEAWNCITTNTIIFYSQSYSYKTMVQAAGRIDRMNTPFHDLYYYHLKSHASLDMAINKALKDKKKFNETGFYNGRG